MHVSEYFQAATTIMRLEGSENSFCKKELKQLQRSKRKGIPFMPLKLFATERNLIKAEIALVQGKKQFDKRQSIQQRTLKKKIEQKKTNSYRG